MFLVFRVSIISESMERVGRSLVGSVGLARETRLVGQDLELRRVWVVPSIPDGASTCPPLGFFLVHKCRQFYVQSRCFHKQLYWVHWVLLVAFL